MSCDSCDSASDVHCSYPSVHIDHSLTSLDLNTLIMRSRARPEPEEPQGSLADSSFELLSRSMCDTSDDEGNTASLASTDGPTPDDLSSFSDSDAFDDDDVEDMSRSIPTRASHLASAPADTEDGNGQHESMITSVADTQPSVVASQGLELEECTLGPDAVSVHGVATRFDEASGVPEVLQGYSVPDLRLSVKMIMSERFLAVRRSYRILFVGKFPDWAITDVNNHVGAALSASPSPSRFNIVQDEGPAGSASSSRVQLERSGPELIVDHCTQPDLIMDLDGTPSVSITLDDGSHLWFGPDQAVRPTSSLPDLIICCHDTSGPDSRTVSEDADFRACRDVIRHSGLPCLDIATVRPYTAEAFVFDQDHLRLCVEGRKQQTQQYKTLNTLPIDLYAFMAIEPSILNRHLARLTRVSSKEKQQSTYGGSRWYRFVARYLKSEETLLSGWWLRWPIFVLALLSVIFMSDIRATPYTKCFGPGIMAVENRSFSLLSAARNSVQMTASTAQVPVATPMSISKSISQVPSNELSTTGWRNTSPESKDNQDGTLEIEITDTHQFTLRPSKQISGRRRKVNFQIQVSQRSERVPVRVTRLPEHVYVVDLEQQYPRGQFNVSVIGKRKPALRQQFEVNLGFNKSSLDIILDEVKSLQRVIVQDLSIARANLKDISSQASQNIHTSMIKMEHEVTAFYKQLPEWDSVLHSSAQEVPEQLYRLKEEANRQLSLGARLTADMSKTLRHKAASTIEDVKLDIWQRSCPLRSSPEVHRARRKALLVRRELEKSFGRDTRKADKQIERASNLLEQAKRYGCSL